MLQGCQNRQNQIIDLNRNIQCIQKILMFSFQSILSFFMNSKGKNPERSIVTLTKNQAQTLHNRLQKFDKIFQAEQNAFQNSNEDLYFLVSVRYIENWRAFCRSSELERQEPIPMNWDLVNQSGKQLKEGLTQGADFQIINSAIHEIIKIGNKGIELPRKSFVRGGEKKVCIYTTPIKYILFINRDLKQIDFNRKDAENFKTKNLYSISEQCTIKSMLAEIKRFERIGRNSKLRAWKAPSSLTIEKMIKDIKQKCRHINHDYKIQGNGILQENLNTIEDAKYTKGEYFIIEMIDEFADWFLREVNEQKCEGCCKFKKLPFKCGCQKVAYCTESCKENDKKYHLKRCTYAEQQELNKKIEMKMTNRSMRGLVGLGNLGNTCFMNSCLQCLSHTLPLTEYFLKSLYEGEINKDNPLGTKGKLVKSYAKFINAMWCQQERVFSPYQLKVAVSSINQMFSGYAQHDSQQFLTFLIDGIHEDLNRVKKKPYVESVESNERSDEIVARESWIAHTKRNQSIVVDLMTGQYKSKVICPDCKKQSITFDPFTTVTLPIPEESSPGVLKYYVLWNNNMQPTKKMSFQYKKSSPSEWSTKASSLLKRSESDFRFFVLTIYEDIYSFQNTGKNQIIGKIEVENKSVFYIQLDESEKKLKQPVELVFNLCKKSYYGDEYDTLWFKRPFWFEKQNTNGLTLAKRVLTYLYYDTYDYSKKRARMSSKSYEVYMEQKIKNRPFELFLKYKKKVEMHYHRRQTKFQADILIKDHVKISELLNKVNIDDCEIDVRFNRDGYREYSFERLKKYDDCTQEISRKVVQTVTVNLQQCFEVLQYPEKLEKGNEWYCSACKDHKLATKEMTVYKAPEILVLHLKRFKSKGLIRKQKNQANIIFPHCLDLTPYVIDPTPISSYTETLKESGHLVSAPTNIEEERLSIAPIYDLYAISNHYGGLGGGHYTAYAKNSSKWYQFNDSSVHEVGQKSFRGSGAYMLFYKRRDRKQI